jgi:DnaK suppressor protein
MQQLALVNAALGRLADGTFGACLRCGQPIAPERLEALPWAAYCISCQADVDKGRR